ncbi:uncharacterized protein TM35_000222050 [Trypanosoma theileri]|uniref:Uncharacterized protein n=1 Tax=Trypanosoma theileri TaxID=67003 RepID=A0A1X0NRR7_9TRYP|nr:uncharacterized protein TM35_000222050 [Trypanosoma theileri]ORC87406.1 hypothetical protein TM35_000222050 [Trypanosoma theileri]
MPNPSVGNSVESTSHVREEPWYSSPIGAIESSLVNADEELIRTAAIATLEADRSQQEVERWRLEADVQIQRLIKMRHEKELLLKEVRQLEQSLNQAETLASASTLIEEKSSSLDGPYVSSLQYNTVTDNSIVVPGTFALASKDSITSKEIELRYLISRSLATLDTLLSDVVSLKKRHADLWTQEKEIGEDIKRLKTTYQRQEEQKEELLKQKYFVKAASTDPAYRKALEEKQEMEEFIAHASDRRAALKQTQMERVSMVAHLLEGLTLRERQASHAHETVARKKGFSEHPMYSMLLSLQEENRELHSKFIKLVQSNEEEDTALVEYFSVLLERLLMTQGNKTSLMDFVNLSPK